MWNIKRETFRKSSLPQKRETTSAQKQMQFSPLAVSYHLHLCGLLMYHYCTMRREVVIIVLFHLNWVTRNSNWLPSSHTRGQEAQGERVKCNSVTGVTKRNFYSTATQAKWRETGVRRIRNPREMHSQQSLLTRHAFPSRPLLTCNNRATTILLVLW